MAMRQNLTNDFYGNIFLIPFSIKFQWLVLKFKCEVYQNGHNRSSEQSVASLFEAVLLCFLNIVHLAYARF